jgi:hypothetical protein
MFITHLKLLRPRHTITVCVYVHVYVCVYICVYVYIYVLSMHVVCM